MFAVQSNFSQGCHPQIWIFLNVNFLERKQEFPIKLKHPTHRPPIIEMILALTAQSLE